MDNAVLNLMFLLSTENVMLLQTIEFLILHS